MPTNLAIDDRLLEEAVEPGLVGGARLSLAQRFAPERFWPEVRRYGVTVVFYAGEMPLEKPTLPKAAETIGFTEFDEEFFRAGLALEQGEHESEEPDKVYAAPSFWRRLFARQQHA